MRFLFIKLCLAQPLSLSFSGDDELGASIFEEDDEGPGDGDGGTTARATDPTPSETSDDDYIPPITSTTTIDVPSTLEGPAA